MKIKSDNLTKDIFKLVFGILTVVGGIVFSVDNLTIYGYILVVSFMVLGTFSFVEGFLDIFIGRKK